MPELDRSMYGKTPTPRWKVGDDVTPDEAPEGVREWKVFLVDGTHVILAGGGLTIRRHARAVHRAEKPTGEPRGARPTLTLFDETGASPKGLVDAMTYPVTCRFCHTIHDAAAVTVVSRYIDCTTWRCPGCSILIDDRPAAMGGSAIRVTKEPS